MDIRNGGIYAADLVPRFGTEPGKLRPVVVVQADAMNLAAHPSTIVCVCTTRVADEANHPLRVVLDPGTGGVAKASEILVDQIRAIDNRRFKRRLGELPGRKVLELRAKLGRVLELA